MTLLGQRWWSAGTLVVAALLALTAAPEARLQAAEDQARIDSPTTGSMVSGMVEIQGRAVGSPPEEFDFYRLYVGIADDPSTLRPIGRPFNKPVEQGVLATANAGLAMPRDYVVVLRVFDKSGNHVETSIAVTVAVQPTPTPFTVLTPLPTNAAFVGAPPARPTQVPVAMDEADALQPFQPFVLPDLPSSSMAPIQQLGSGPELDSRPSDPVKPDNDDLHDLNP